MWRRRPAFAEDCVCIHPRPTAGRRRHTCLFADDGLKNIAQDFFAFGRIIMRIDKADACVRHMEEAFHVGVGFGVAVFEYGGSRQVVHSRSALLTLIDFEIGLFDIGIVLDSLTDVFDGAAQSGGRFFLTREFDGTDDKCDVFVLRSQSS